MTEINRLSFFIRTIDKDFTVLPVGEFIITEINKLRRNDLFEGFNQIDLNKKEKYIYFKMDKVLKGKKIMDKAVLNFDFCDSIVDDIVYRYNFYVIYFIYFLY